MAHPSKDPRAREDVERLIELAGGVTDAARAMGKTGKKLAGGKSLISQWRNGTKAPSDKSLQKIREVIDRLEAEGPRKHKRRPGQRARISREEFDAALARARTRKSKRQTLAAALARELGSSYRTARSTAEGFGVDLGKKRARLTRTKVEDALMKSAGDMHEAARSLGVTWHALQRRMVEWGMKDPAPEVVKVTDEEVLDAMARHGSHRGKAAADLGIPYRRMLDRLHRIGVRRELKATKKQIKAALKKHCGDRGKAAREVGLSYQYFVKRLRDLGFRRPGQWGRKKCWPPSKEELVTLLHEYRGDRGAVADVLWENVKNVYQLQREYMITSDRIRAANEYGWIYIPSPANYITGAASESMADIEALVSLGAFGEDPAEGAKVTIHGRGGRRMSRDEREGAYKDPAYLWLRERGEHEGWALPTQENPAPPRRFRRRRLNPDVDARRAMRSYAAGGSVQQAASALASRLRSGELQRGHLEALSCMGDQAAEFVVGPCPGEWPSDMFAANDEITLYAGRIYALIVGTAMVEALLPILRPPASGAVEYVVGVAKQWLRGDRRGFYMGAFTDEGELAHEVRRAFEGFMSRYNQPHTMARSATLYLVKLLREVHGGLRDFPDTLWAIQSSVLNALSLDSFRQGSPYGHGYRRAIQGLVLDTVRPWFLAGAPDTWELP